MLKPFEEITRGLPPPPPAATQTVPAGGSRDRLRPPGRDGARSRTRRISACGRHGVGRTAGRHSSARLRSRSLLRDGRRCRRIPDQRQRQQRRRVAVCAGGGVRQQPEGPRVAVQRRPRRRPGQLGVRLESVHVRRAADGEARLQRRPRRSARSADRSSSRKLLRNGPTVFVAVQYADDHNSTTQPGVMPTLLERGGDFSRERRCVRRPAHDRRSAHRTAVPGQRDPELAHQPAGGLAPRLLPAAESPDGGGYNFQAPLITAARQDLDHDARDAADQQPQPADRLVRVSAHAHRSDDAVRVRRRERRVRRRHVGDLDAPDQPVLLDSSARAVHADHDERDAVLRQPHERVRRRRHHGQQSGSRRTGVRRA